MAVKLNGWSKVVIWVAGIVFLAGIAFATIGFNTKSINANTVRIEKNTGEIDSLKKMEGKIEAMDVRQGIMAEDVATIKKVLLENR